MACTDPVTKKRHPCSQRELIEVDVAKPEGKGLEIVGGPGYVPSAIQPGKALERWPHMMQILIDGRRVGYVNTKPGGPITYIVKWHPQQKVEVDAAVTEWLGKQGFDVSRPRKFADLRAKKLIGKPADVNEMTETSDPE